MSFFQRNGQIKTKITQIIKVWNGKNINLNDKDIIGWTIELHTHTSLSSNYFFQFSFAHQLELYFDSKSLPF